MSCAGVLYRLVAYLSSFMDICYCQIQQNPFPLELQLPGIGFKHGWKKTLPLSPVLLRRGVSKAVFLSFGADSGRRGNFTPGSIP